MEKLPNPDAEEAMSAEAEVLRRVMANGKRVHERRNYPYVAQPIMDASFFGQRDDENWCREHYGMLDIDVCRDRWMITIPANMFNPMTSWADLRSDDEYTTNFYRAFTYVIDALYNPNIGEYEQTEAGPSPSFVWLMRSRDTVGQMIKRPKQHIAVEVIIRNHGIYSDDKTVLSDSDLFHSNNIIGLRIHVMFLDFTIRPGLYLVAKLWENQLKLKIIQQDQYDQRMKILQRFGCSKFYLYVEKYYYDNGQPSTAPAHVSIRQQLKPLHEQIVREIRNEAHALANQRVNQMREEIDGLEGGDSNPQAEHIRKRVLRDLIRELEQQGFVAVLDESILAQLIPGYKVVRRKNGQFKFKSEWNRNSAGGRSWDAGATRSVADIIRAQMSTKHEDLSKNINARNPEFTVDLSAVITDPEEAASRTIINMPSLFQWVLRIFDGPSATAALNEQKNIETLYAAADYNLDDPMSPVNPSRVFSFEKSCRLLSLAVPPAHREALLASRQFIEASYKNPESGQLVFPYSRLVFQYLDRDFCWERLRNSFLPFFSFSNGIEQMLLAIESQDRKNDEAAAVAAATANASELKKTFLFPVEVKKQSEKPPARMMREGDEYDDQDQEAEAMEQDSQQPDHSSLTPEKIRRLKIERMHAAQNNSDDTLFANPSDIFVECKKDVLHGNLGGLASKSSLAKRNENDVVKIESCLEEPRRYLEKLSLRVRAVISRHPDYQTLLLTKLREEGMTNYLNFMHPSCDKLPKQYLSIVSFFENKRMRSPFQPLFNTWIVDGKTTVFASMMGNILLQLSHSCIIHSNFDTAIRLLMYSIHDQFDMSNNRTPLHSLLFGETQAGKSLILYLIRLCTIEGVHQDASTTSKSARHTMAVQDGLVITSEEGNSLVTTDQAALNPAQQDAANMYKNIMTERSASRVTFFSHPVTKLPLQLAYQTSVRATIIMACDHLENSKHTSNRNRFRLETMLPMLRKDKTTLDTLGSSNNPTLKLFQSEFCLQRQTQMALNARGWTAVAFQVIPAPDVSLFLIGLNRGISAITDYGIVDFAERGRAIGRGTRISVNSTMNAATGYLMLGEQSPYMTRDDFGVVRANKQWKESDIEKIGKDMFCTTDIAVHALDQTFGDLVDEKVELLLQIAGRGLCGFNAMLFHDLYTEAKEKKYFKVPNPEAALTAKGLDPVKDMPMFIKEYNALMMHIMRLRYERGHNVQERYETKFCLQVTRTIPLADKQTAVAIITMLKDKKAQGEEDAAVIKDMETQITNADNMHSVTARQENLGALGRIGSGVAAARRKRVESTPKDTNPSDQADAASLAKILTELSTVQTEYNPMFVQFIGTWEQLSAEINALAKDIIKHSPILTKDMLQSMSHRKISVPKLKPIRQIYEPLEFVKSPAGGTGRNAILWEEVNIIQLEQVTNTSLISAMTARVNTREVLYRIKISTHWLFLNKQSIRYEFISQLENKHTRPQRTVLSTTHRSAQMAFHTLDIGPNPNVTLQTTQRDYCAKHIVQNFYMHALDENSKDDFQLQEEIETAMCELLISNATSEEPAALLTEKYSELQKKVEAHKKKRKADNNKNGARTTMGSRLFSSSSTSNAQPGDLFNLPAEVFLEEEDPEQVLYKRFILREYGSLPDVDLLPQYPGNRAAMASVVFEEYADFKRHKKLFSGFSYPRTIIEDTQRAMQMQEFMYRNNPNAYYCESLEDQVKIRPNSITYEDDTDHYGTPSEFDENSMEKHCRRNYMQFLFDMRESYNKTQQALVTTTKQTPKMITEKDLTRQPAVADEAALEMARREAAARAKEANQAMNEDETG